MYRTGSSFAKLTTQGYRLRVPYGGEDWFNMIRKTTERCAKLGLQVWLYDEDPYPSGAVGGRVFIERPEFEFRAIERFEFNPNEGLLLQRLVLHLPAVAAAPSQ